MGPRISSDGPAGRTGCIPRDRRGSRRMGPQVASDGPAGRVGWARGSHRMGQRVGPDASRGTGAGRIGWAPRSHRMGLRVASDGPAAFGIGWARGSGQIGPRVTSDGPGRVASDAVGPRVGSRRRGRRVASEVSDLSWQDSHVLERVPVSTARFLKVYQSFVRLQHHSSLADPASRDKIVCLFILRKLPTRAVLPDGRSRIRGMPTPPWRRAETRRDQERPDPTGEGRRLPGGPSPGEGPRGSSKEGGEVHDTKLRD